jgi:hypothetical protein
VGREVKRQLAIPVAVTLACVFFDVYLMGLPLTLWGLALVVFIRLAYNTLRMGQHAVT